MRRQSALCHKGVQLVTFWPGHIQALDSLDMEGNLGTKQDALSSQASPVDGQLDDKASYWMSRVNPI